MIRVIQFVLVHSEETRYLMSVATAGIPPRIMSVVTLCQLPPLGM